MLKRVLSTIDFGTRTVSMAEKQPLVDEVFHSVASSYDIMNDLMSMGIHRLWKDEFVSDMGRFPMTKQLKVLDMAGGTGDIAFRIMEKAKRELGDISGIEVTVADINKSMLDVGVTRAKPEYNLLWKETSAEELDFPDNSFDYYTISFGIRNVPDRPKALREALRVLKPGGRFMCLEFSKIEVPYLDDVYKYYSQWIIPSIGHVVAGDRDSYQYLVDSIEKFPSQKEFAEVINDAGFKHVASRNLTYGIVCIHSGIKLNS